jgi:hypothetical protein
MSKWYGAGGHCNNDGLTMSVASDRKPENGIQNSACGWGGVVLWLKLVNTAEDESSYAEDASSGLFHVMKVLKEHVWPWASTASLLLITRISLRSRAQKGCTRRA